VEVIYVFVRPSITYFHGLNRRTNFLKFSSGYSLEVPGQFRFSVILIRNKA
jgi:hypothetical protein